MTYDFLIDSYETERVKVLSVWSHGPTIYAYFSVQALVEGEARGGAKSRLPAPPGSAVTERPG